MTETGILIANLGTPAAPETKAVRRYLREFLSDERVLDVPAPVRAVLVNGIIAPLRGPKSAEAYRTVWTDAGSPLLVHSLALRDGLRRRLGDTPVELGMRYGEPSLAGALEALVAAGCDRVLFAPLYPQYASSSTGSSVAELYRVAAQAWNTPFVEVLPPFFDDPRFLDVQASLVRDALAEHPGAHVLFSYHGLPERHCTKSDPTGAHCLASEACCDRIVPANRSCYRAQCFATTRGLAERLGLGPDDHSISFQSRLGRDPWIRPFTDERVPELAKSGVKTLVVACPSFVADCLETIEEIGDRAAEDFREAGGERLVLAPCLNADERWCDALAGMLRERVAS